MSLARLASADGVTVFLTTHNLAEAERLCALVGVVRAGRLVAFAAPSDLRGRADGAHVEITGSGLTAAARVALGSRDGVLSLDVDGRRLALTVTDSSLIPSIVSSLVGTGFQVEQVRSADHSLEETFVALMQESS